MRIYQKDRETGKTVSTTVTGRAAIVRHLDSSNATMRCYGTLSELAAVAAYAGNRNYIIEQHGNGLQVGTVWL